MKKLGVLLLGGAVALGIGAGGFFGPGLFASQAMASSPNPQAPAIEGLKLADMAQSENANDAYIMLLRGNEITLPDEAAPAADGEESILVAGSSSVVSKEYVENGGTIMVNGKEVLLKDYIYGEEPGADDISKETAIDAATKVLAHKYALDQELLDRFTITAKFYSIYEGIAVPVWWVNLYPVNTDEFTEIGCYTAILDASTGEALHLLSAADGKG